MAADASGLQFMLENELTHVRCHMIFNFGKSCESTKPTGSRIAFKTIKSSMFSCRLFWLMASRKHQPGFVFDIAAAEN
jgi:hypothetical protein